jgi:hypothetical protein
VSIAANDRKSGLIWLETGGVDDDVAEHFLPGRGNKTFLSEFGDSIFQVLCVRLLESVQIVTTRSESSATSLKFR